MNGKLGASEMRGLPVESLSKNEMMTVRYHHDLSAKLYRIYVAVALMGLLTVTLGMDVL